MKSGARSYSDLRLAASASTSPLTPVAIHRLSCSTSQSKTRV